MKFGRIRTSVSVRVALWTFAILVLVVPVCAQQQSDNTLPEPALEAPKDARENLNSLLANPSTFDPVHPAEVMKENGKGFTRELIRVEWRYGDPIDLWVMRPEGVEKPPVILYLYSYPSDADRFRDEGYGERVTRGGYAAVGFVSALTGQRYHGVPMKEWFVSDLSQVLVATAHDVQMVLNYLATRGDMDMDRVGIYGQGSGGTIAVLAAAVDPRIKALNLLDPWGDWPDWMAKSIRVPASERPAYLKPDFLKQAAPFDIVRWLPKLKSRPVRVQDIATDGITPAVCQKKIEFAARSASAAIVKYKNVEEMLVSIADGKGFEWIKDQVKPAAAPAAAD